uniref:Uncharacterized protein n=1 Tax=Anopheles merus TaxID=30066 RepID=A0A182UY77_ANOME
MSPSVKVLDGAVLVNAVVPKPFFASATPRGMRTEVPRSATPQLNLSIDDVSSRPTNRRSLSFPPRGSYALMCLSCFFDSFSIAASIALIPFSARIGLVEKLQCPPAPFQLPSIGFGSNDVARQPQIVGTLHTERRPDLVLPLGRHDLRVRAGKLDARVQAGDRVRLGNIASDHVLRPGRTVVRALRSRETAHRPAERTPVNVQEGVLLLDAKPRLQILRAVVRVLHGGPVVRGRRLPIRLVRVAQHDHIVRARLERVFVERARDQLHVRVAAERLVGGATVVLPRGHIFRRLRHVVEDAILQADVLAGAVDPDVACTYFGSYFSRVYRSSSVLLRCAFGECSRILAQFGPRLVLIMRTDGLLASPDSSWRMNSPTTRRAIFFFFTEVLLLLLLLLLRKHAAAARTAAVA